MTNTAAPVGYLIYTGDTLVGTCKNANVARDMMVKGHRVIAIYV